MLTIARSVTEPDRQPSLIEKTPGVCGGEACIRRTRIPVWSLVRMRQLGMVDDEIGGAFVPSLSAEDLSAAWRYSADHPLEIDNAIHENEAE